MSEFATVKANGITVDSLTHTVTINVHTPLFYQVACCIADINFQLVI